MSATRHIAHGLLLAVGAGMPLSAQAEGPTLPDTFLSRVETVASMETLNADLLAARSATKVLETWCADHKLASPAKIRAEAIATPGIAPTPDQRKRLTIGPDEPVRYRHVRLMCGPYVLSEADNWYVPSRLTPEMNRLLDTSDTPFGKAVAALRFTRETFAVEILWRALPPDWQVRTPAPDRPAAPLDVPPVLFVHHALLYDHDHRPFSEVAEHYTRATIDFRKTK